MRTDPATVRRWLLRLATFAYAVTLVIAVTGGGRLMVGAIRLSARGTRNTLIVIALSIAGALALAPRGRRWEVLAADWRAVAGPLERALSWPMLRRHATGRGAGAAVAVAFAAGALLIGAGGAGASDSYGYVSQARLWLNGRLQVEQPMLRDLPAGVPPETFVPLAYRLSSDGTAIVPVYAPGYPMVMAAFEGVGGPSAVYAVMPLLGGVAVWCTYLLGAQLVAPAVGLIAALLLATSPSVLFIANHSPMSDIPAMAWWVLALVLGRSPSAGWALLSGIAAGAAILTRPNLVPLAVIVGALPIWLARRHAGRAGAVRSAALFAAGPLAASLAIGALNTRWYGSPAASGYGDLAGVLYRWDFLWPSVASYAAWLWQSQKWTVAAAIAGIVVGWKHWPPAGSPGRPALATSALFGLCVCLAYAFYLPLQDWWTLRLLFPAFPMLCILAATGIMSLPAVPLLLRPAVVVLVAALAIASARERGAFDTASERRFEAMGSYIASELPQSAVLVSMIHSGSANFYSGRLTVRWDMLRGEQLDPLLEELRRLGYIPFILLDDFEEPQFTERFRGASRLAPLDWEPIVTMPRARLFGTTPSPGPAPPPTPTART